MKKKETEKPRFWVCIIGDTEWNKLPPGADLPMRQAVEKAFRDITGHYAENNWSGWSADKKTAAKLLSTWSKQR